MFRGPGLYEGVTGATPWFNCTFLAAKRNVLSCTWATHAVVAVYGILIKEFWH